MRILDEADLTGPAPTREGDTLVAIVGGDAGPSRWIPGLTVGERIDRIRRSAGLSPVGAVAVADHREMLERLIYAIHMDAGEMDGLGPMMSDGVIFEAMTLAGVPFARSDNPYEEEWSYRIDRAWLDKMRQRVGY